MSDFSDTIERLGDFATYTVTRYKTRGTTEGKIDPLRIESTLTITACVQPASGRDLQRLEEGFRTGEVIVLWAKTKLYPLGVDAQSKETKPPDTLVYENDTYQVEACDNWGHLGNYYEALARKVSV